MAAAGEGAADAAGVVDAPLTAYARPHEIDLTREAGGDAAVEAVVVRIQAIGPIVRVELRPCGGGALIEAELGKIRCHELNLQSGERVYVRPCHMRLFGPGDTPS